MLNLVPGKRETLEATLAVLRAKLEQARLDLNKTIIRAPIRCRIGDVAIEAGQFLQAGELLFEADGVAVTEVDVQLPMIGRGTCCAQSSRRRWDEFRI